MHRRTRGDVCLIVMKRPRTALLQDTETALGCTEGCHSSVLAFPRCWWCLWAAVAEDVDPPLPLAIFSACRRKTRLKDCRDAAALLPLILLHPLSPLEMLLLHSGEQWVLWLWSEIIHDKRKKIMCLDQTKKKDFRNFAEMRETKQLVWG